MGQQGRGATDTCGAEELAWAETYVCERDEGTAVELHPASVY